jgi:hypothetical protein
MDGILSPSTPSAQYAAQTEMEREPPGRTGRLGGEFGLADGGLEEMAT